MRGKRGWFLAMGFLFLLTGCSGEEKPLEEDTEKAKQYTLMDGRQAVEAEGDVWYIPNEDIDGREYAELYPYGDDLLVRETVYVYDGADGAGGDADSDISGDADGDISGDADGDISGDADGDINGDADGDIGEEGSFYTNLSILSLADGTRTAYARFPSAGGETIQIIGESILLNDPVSGLITILDGDLKETGQYCLESSVMDTWYVDSDMDTLYSVGWDEGIWKVDLVSGRKENLMPYARHVSVCGASGDYVIFSYNDARTRMNEGASLDLTRGTIEGVPSSEVCGYGSSRTEEVWLLADEMEVFRYKLCTADGTWTVSPEERELKLLPEEGHLLAIDSMLRNMELYELDGTFISRCSFPEDMTKYIGTTFVWNDYWDGYFFTDCSETGVQLMFWDTGAESTGDSLVMNPFEEDRVPDGESADPELYARAAELSERFGVDIRIADQCQFEYTDFSSEEDCRSEEISQALDILEESMEDYPEGFFEQIRYGNIRSLRIELVGNLTPKEGYLPSAAFSQEKEDYNLIVFDLPYVTEWNFYHEMAHIIDHYLEWDALFGEDSVYNWDSWMAMQPEGFDYAYSYMEMPEETLAYEDSGYFVMNYSMTYPTEDRATMMEAAMMGDPVFRDHPELKKKMEYYSRCIRDVFDTDGWEEQTMWEKIDA